MNVLRRALLGLAENAWVLDHAPKYRFVRKTASRFMPGETLEQALTAARSLTTRNLGVILSYLSEHVNDTDGAAAITGHYLQALRQIQSLDPPLEISVKLSQLGLDDPDRRTEICLENLRSILEQAGARNRVWIDMESSPYVDRTLAVYRKLRPSFPRLGVCIQAYLHRSLRDLEGFFSTGASIRLVKGAYREPADRAYPRRQDIDRNFIRLAKQLLTLESLAAGVETAIATHDPHLIRHTEALAASAGLGKGDFEYQMLYGIQTTEQLRLAREGYRSQVLICYGEQWFPWFMRRLAERPANLGSVVRNLF